MCTACQLLVFVANEIHQYCKWEAVVRHKPLNGLIDHFCGVLILTFRTCLVSGVWCWWLGTNCSEKIKYSFRTQQPTKFACYQGESTKCVSALMHSSSYELLILILRFLSDNHVWLHINTSRRCATSDRSLNTIKAKGLLQYNLLIYRNVGLKKKVGK